MMGRTTGYFLVVGLVAGSSAMAATQVSGEPLQWLKRMIEARRTVSYEGDFVYLHSGQITTLHIVRQAEPGGDRERLIALDGPMREVVRDRERVTCTLPKGKPLVADTHHLPDGALSENLSQHLDEVMAHYDLTPNHPDRVAGREVWSLEIRPRDALRYGHRLWLDMATGLLLKSELIGKRGNTLEEIMFTQVTVLPTIPAGHLESSTVGLLPALHTSVTTTTASDEPLRWTVERLPPGFRLEGREHHPLGLKGVTPAQQFVYSDGLATVSVFIEHTPADHEAVSGPSRRGGLNAYGTRYKDWQVTVVGEVPEATVEMIGTSLRRHDPLEETTKQ
ncbi:sigma-E factor negative regulatory protein RseB [Gammaproteobacteria bacterium]